MDNLDLKMFRLSRKEFDDIVDTLFVNSGLFTEDVVVVYKDKLFKAIKQLENDVLSNVKDTNELKAISVGFLDKIKTSSYFSSKSHVLLNIPLIIPFDFAALLVFIRSLSVYAFMRLVDNVINNGLSGLKDITSSMFPSISHDDQLSNIPLPTDYKKEDLN